MLVLFYGVFIQETPEEGWHDLVAKGFIEYIDTEEEETTMISMTINVSKICHAKYAKLTICRAPKVTFPWELLLPLCEKGQNVYHHHHLV